MSISNRNVYTKIVYEKSMRKVYIQPKSLYGTSVSNRSVYKKCLYLTEKSIREVNIQPESLCETYIRKFYI